MSAVKSAIAAVAALAAALAQPAHAAQKKGSAQELRGRDIFVIRIPQFVATAVRFKAIDETGYDWAGSDEVYAVFADFNPIAEHVTSLFGNVDTGDTGNFRASQSCLTPQPSCDRGRRTVQFAVSLWERDEWGFADWFDLEPPVAPNSHENYQDGLSDGDDLIGRGQFGFSQQQLLGMLPTVGDVVERTARLTGGDGKYDFTYRITRLPDIERSIVIHEPPISTGGISLTATLENQPRRVSLNWSNATGNNVDILRGAALIATTPNDGQHTDRVPAAGTYQYRVCNAGMTTCSPVVSITVP